MNQLFQGAATALVTPFDGGGIAADVLRDLVEFQIERGIAALVPCGSTGEAATMSAEEQSEVIRIVADAAGGRVPVIAGVGGSNTRDVALLARNAGESGADGLLISAPPYNKPTQSGIVAHYREVMDAGDLPTIVYNVPSRTSCNILPATVVEIADDSRVVGVKEACGDISQVAELCRRVGDRLAVYSGNDDQVVPLLALGGRGVISVFSNIAPAVVSGMVRSFLDGDADAAREVQLRYLPLIHLLFSEPNPIPVKAAVGLLGFEAGDVRLPLTSPSEATMTALREQMAEMRIESRAHV